MEEEKEHERWNPKDLELCLSQVFTGLPRWLSGKESAHQCRRCNRRRFHPRVGKIPWRRKWQPTPVFLSWKSHGQRNLVGYSPWGCKESDTTEQLNSDSNKYYYLLVGWIEKPHDPSEPIFSLQKWGHELLSSLGCRKDCVRCSVLLRFTSSSLFTLLIAKRKTSHVVPTFLLHLTCVQL